MEIGVRELKARLSEFLDRAEAGETIVVTDRGKAKALLGPLRITSAVHSGIAAGWIRPGNGAQVKRVRPAKGVRTTEEVLAEDRGD
jgi:prevent-host-death family protein